MSETVNHRYSVVTKGIMGIIFILDNINETLALNHCHNMYHV